MRDFMGLNVHTVTFRPELYAPVTRQVRDYHPFVWDVGQETDYALHFPMARNGVDWGSLYGSWRKAGYRIDASVQVDPVKPASWKDAARDAFAYGKAFAVSFGPSSSGLVESFEVGNEPGGYADDVYRTVFENMARGAREGDPRLLVSACASNLGKSGKYSKSVDCLAGLEALYDIVNIHIYPEVEGWPTWRRSFPEDPKINFLRDIGHVLAWRDEHVPEKQVWLTEFGYDASTKPHPETGDFARWEGSTELQQAQWTVRAFLTLAATKLDRAYLFYFNDDDEPHVHGSSGLTRKYQPKPAFYAVAHLQLVLGGFRFARVVREDATMHIYEFLSEDGRQRIWATWKLAGDAEPINLDLNGAAVAEAVRMPLAAGAAEAVEVHTTNGTATVTVGATPVYLWLE